MIIGTKFVSEAERSWIFFNAQKKWAQKETALLDSRNNCAVFLQVGGAHPLAAIFHSDHYSRGVLNEAVHRYIPSRFYWHYLEHPDLLFNPAGRSRKVSQVLKNYPCALMSGVTLQEEFRPGYVNPPRTFEIDTYCPREQAYGYDCRTCTQNKCLGFVETYKLEKKFLSVSAPNGSFPSGHLVDGNLDTFWEFTSANSIMVEFESESSAVPEGYSLSTGYHGEGGKDSLSRMPKRWKLYGKTNEKWTLLDNRVTGNWAPRETRFFDLDSTTRFSRFKFEFGVLPNKTIRIYEISFKLKENVRKLSHPDEAHDFDKLGGHDN